MEFLDFVQDEREEWAAQDITKAFVKKLTELAGDAARSALSELQAGEFSSASFNAGKAAAYELASEIATIRRKS